MTRSTLNRRSFVRTAAALAVTTALAGCGDSDGSGADGDGSDGGGGDGNGGDGGDGDGNGGDGGGDAEFLAEEPDYDGWFDDVSNYEGTLDRTGTNEVGVGVGTDGGLSYGPAAVAVSPGTTVVWEWTGEGGDHDVAASDGAFDSDTAGEEGHTFAHTFEESGVYTYFCTPHEAVGMKGAVYVE